jgi:hypothetical protein
LAIGSALQKTLLTYHRMAARDAISLFFGAIPKESLQFWLAAGAKSKRCTGARRA